jgi:hypothetical protein
MDDILQRHPEIADYLDPTPGMENTASQVVMNGRNYVVVRQVSEFEGGMLVLEDVDGKLRPAMADNFFELGDVDRQFEISALARGCGPSSGDDHETLAAHSLEQVGRFSSRNGPDRGNLACVWAVRHLAHQALARWITRTDGTAVLYPELKACMGPSLPQEEVPAGGIVISPTKERPGRARIVGHVGLLGPATLGADDRLIYSNTSARAVWEQNFTLGSWRRRYEEQKGLETHFYKLPLRGSAPTS